MTPEKYLLVRESMSSILHEIKASPKLDRESLAYTLARTQNLVGTVYRIFINNSNSELARFLYMHECGHIIYGHAKNLEIRTDKYLRLKITAAYNKVQDAFDTPQSMLEYFRNMIYNMVMDFEVNSKMYTRAEWAYMNGLVSTVTHNPDAKGLWPEDFGFPIGLNWNEYLNLILINPRRFIKNLKTSFEQKNGTEQAPQNNTSIKTSEPEGDEDTTQEPQPVPQLYEDDTSEQNCIFTKEEIEKIKEIASDHCNSDFNESSQTMSGYTRSNDGVKGVDFDEYDDMNDLVRRLKRLLLVSQTVKNRRDPLYNYNRKKYSTDIIIPRTVNNIIHRKATLYLLFDVSGSVNPRLVHSLLESFKSFGKEFKDTVTITWNTRLVSEGTLGEKTESNYGGGTFVAKGIFYVNQKYKLKNKDVLFVISDFCDNLEEWKMVLSTLHCKKYGVNWKSDVSPVNPGFDKVLKAKNEYQ